MYMSRFIIFGFCICIFLGCPDREPTCEELVITNNSVSSVVFISYSTLRALPINKPNNFSDDNIDRSTIKSEEEKAIFCYTEEEISDINVERVYFIERSALEDNDWGVILSDSIYTVRDYSKSEIELADWSLSFP